MKAAILFGASGNIGSHLLRMLLASDEYYQIKIVVRKPLNIRNPNLVTLIGDYDSLSDIKEKLNADDVFIILGATDKNVERNYPVLIAQLCKEQGAKSISLVTSVGANPQSAINFTKIKGEIEQDILNLKYSQTNIFHPGLIMGKRAFYRPMEKIVINIWRIINPFLIGKLSRYRGMEAQQIASAMYMSANKNSESINIFHWKEMDYITKKHTCNDIES